MFHKIPNNPHGNPIWLRPWQEGEEDNGHDTGKVEEEEEEEEDADGGQQAAAERKKWEQSSYGSNLAIWPGPA